MLQSLAAVAIAAAVATASSDQPPPRTLVVQLVHRCRPASSCLSRRTVHLMKKETQRIWSSLDVRIVWTDSNEAGSAASAAGLTVVLEEGAYTGATLDRGVVLAALNQPASVCGWGLARVWVRHIEDHAALVWRGKHASTSLLPAFANTFLGRALGRALAHEIGHYLLGTRNTPRMDSCDPGSHRRSCWRMRRDRSTGLIPTRERGSSRVAPIGEPMRGNREPLSGRQLPK
jgi:hypothetical protein